MNYINRYGMKRNPFINTKVSDAYITEDVLELNHRLKYLQQVKGLGVVYGDHGSGKTFNIRCFIQSLSNITYKTIYISQTSVGVFEIYKQIALGLDVPVVCIKIDLFIAIQAKIKELSIKHQITTVIVIDEANRLHLDVINNLELLLNFDIDASRYCLLILCGKKELINLIPDSLADRAMMKYNVTGIKQTEVKAYIKHMLIKAGCNESKCDVFDESAINALSQCCENNVRKLNMLIDKCLFFANHQKLLKISNELVMLVFNEVTIK